MSIIKVNAIQHTSANGSNMTLFANGNVAMIAANAMLTVGNTVISNSGVTVGSTIISNAGISVGGSLYGSFGPAFSAYNTGGQSVTGGVYTKLQINTEEFDTANCFDSTTNYRFTPTVAGYYLFTFNAENGAATARLTTYLYKNGSVFKNGVDSIGNGSNSNSSNGSALAYANGSSDYFELYVQGNNAQSIQPGSAVTYFQAFLVRPA